MSAAESARLREAVLTIRDLRARLEAAGRPRAEPIAIVGLGCRFPGGADSPEAFWRLLADGVDAVSEVPRERWDADAIYDPDFLAPGKATTRRGGFLDEIDRFDPAFFGISPREATRMDPQQRLLLEVSYRTLEDAGQALERLDGSATGVFVGAHNHASEYGRIQLEEPESIDTYTATGTAHSLLANRLSYVFGLEGPSLVVDTACSSSLVAVHLACRSLREGECDLALAGGVNLILGPETTIALSKLQMLAPDGRCKTFDARADGFVRGEGCGFVALRRLADALAGGDRIYAVIAGTAVNQDGRTNGLTAPSGLAQRRVVRRALEQAGVPAGEIGLVETHGTGTALGDPIEVEALAEALAVPRPDGQMCALGSVKTNLGHLETAAGVAGLIKAALALEREAIPPNLHFRELSPHISLAGTPFSVPTELRPWPTVDAPRYAGVSSFGWGGTNAHAVLAEAPRRGERDPEGVGRDQLLPLSARDPEALRGVAASYAAFLANDPPPLADVAWTAASRRTEHGHRLAVVGSSPAELAGRLDAFARGDPSPGLTSGRTAEEPPGIVFVFPGQGAQALGMGLVLLADEPVFRETIERCDEAFRPLAGWSLVDELRAGEGSSRLERTEVAQPLLFALQIGLAELFRSLGIVPEAVVGHSAGEVAAAYAAGALGLEDAVSVAFERGRVLQKACGLGKMAAAALPPTDAERVAGEHGVTLATVNSPSSVVFAGEPARIDALVAALRAADVFARVLHVDFASHSPALEPFREELVTALAGIEAREPATAIVSTVTGEPAAPGDFGAAYWGRNVREPVRFRAAIDLLAARGHASFLELSPHPVLGAAVAQCLEHEGRAGAVHASLRRGQDERATVLQALGEVWVEGRPVRWEALHPAGGDVVTLPLYPFRRGRYWLEREARPASRARATLSHPFLRERLRSPALEEAVFPCDLSAAPPLGEHRIGGVAVLPVSVHLELAFAAATELDGEGPAAVEEMRFHEPLILSDGAEAPELQLLASPRGADGRDFRICALTDGEEWTLHASGRLRRLPAGAAPPPAPPGDAVEVRLSEGSAGDSFRFPPPLLDAVLAVFAETWPDGVDGHPYLPVSIDRFTLLRPPGDRVAVRVRARTAPAGAEEGTLVADLWIGDEHGATVAAIEGLLARRVDPSRLARGGSEPWRDWLYTLDWRPVSEPPAPAAEPGEWLVLADAGGTGGELAAALERRGASVTVRPWTEAAAGLEELERLRGVVHLCGLDLPLEPGDGQVLSEASTRACASVLEAVRAISAGGAGARIHLVTRGAQPAGGEPESVSAPQAALWGLGRVIALEQPALWGGLVDLDASEKGGDADPVAAELLGSDGEEDQVALRGGRRLVPRLARAKAEPGDPIRFRADGSYLITGGLGGLGLEVASWAARSGVGHLVLAGRHGLPERAAWPGLAAGSDDERRARAVAGIETLGASVEVVDADVGDPVGAAAALAAARRHGPLRGIVHAAAIVEPCPLLDLDEPAVRRTLAGKAGGAWNLHRLSAGDELDLFLLFSSTTGLWGSSGLAHYAAANQVLDALAHHRRESGLPATSVDWGLWDVTRPFTADVRALALTTGLRAMPAAGALEALGRVAASARPQWTVASVDWPGLTAVYEARRPRPLLSGLGRQEGDTGTRPGTPALAQRLEEAPARARYELLRSHVQQEVASVLGIESPEALDPTSGFFTLGMDSLTSVELKTRLEAALGLPLSASLAFNHPTVEALTERLAEMLELAPVRIGGSASERVEVEAGWELLSDDELVAVLESRLEELR